MAIDVKDLPPAYQVQALQKLVEREKRRTPLPSPAHDAPQKASKYHNKPTERVTPAGNVLRFDSQKEAWRYDELAELERQGIIRDLRMQVDFTLQEAYTDRNGQRVRAIRYRADFVYLRQVPLWEWERDQEWARGKPVWDRVVEDVKSRATRTKEYLMKRKLMKERFNIDIQEV